jgi:hypothetical protein
VKISAAIPDEPAVALEERARAEDRSASAVVRRALAEHLSSAATLDLRPTESRTPNGAVEAHLGRDIEASA